MRKDSQQQAGEFIHQDSAAQVALFNDNGGVRKYPPEFLERKKKQVVFRIRAELRIDKFLSGFIALNAGEGGKA